MVLVENISKYAKVVIIRARMGILIAIKEKPESNACPIFCDIISTPVIAFSDEVSFNILKDKRY